jgi:uncharacterized repeat protein (TIGR01451 family)
MSKVVISRSWISAGRRVGSPNPVELGGNITWTIVVTNNGPDTATGGTISDPMPAGNPFVWQQRRRARLLTITLATTPSAVGTVTNTVTVVGRDEHRQQHRVGLVVVNSWRRRKIASKDCKTKRIGMTGVFTPPVTG